MAPVTHPDTVNPLIERFLEATQPPLAGDRTKSVVPMPQSRFGPETKP